MDRDLRDFLRFIVIPITVLVALMFAGGWYASGRAAEIFNAQHGTHYTAGDFFWAENQINAQSQTVNLKTN